MKYLRILSIVPYINYYGIEIPLDHTSYIKHLEIEKVNQVKFISPNMSP